MASMLGNARLIMSMSRLTEMPEMVQALAVGVLKWEDQMEILSDQFLAEACMEVEAKVVVGKPWRMLYRKDVMSCTEPRRQNARVLLIGGSNL